MVRTKVQRDFDVDHRVASQHALGDGFVDTFFDRRDVFAWNHAALDGVDKFDALAGHVVLKIEPNEAGKGIEFVDAIKGGVVPREFIPAVEKGINEAVTQGVLAGYPVVDVKVTLHFGSYHDVDSNELAFKMAAIFGFKEGCRKANPVILEPMMAVEVETPEDYAGNVMGDLSSRRGMVQGMEDIPGGGKAIKAEVPLSEMFGYSTTLRSATQGRATYSMEFKHYSEAPRNVSEAIMAARSK